MPRALAAALVLLAVAAVTVLIAVVVVAGITGQNAELSAGAAAGVDRLQSWLGSAGVDSSSASGAAPTVKYGGAADHLDARRTESSTASRGLASVLFGLSLAALGTFFLLKDGPPECATGWTATSGCRTSGRAHDHAAR